MPGPDTKSLIRKLCSDFNPTYVRPSYKSLCDPSTCTFHWLPDTIRGKFPDRVSSAMQTFTLHRYYTRYYTSYVHVHVVVVLLVCVSYTNYTK